jgi:hypothetical protein
MTRDQGSAVVEFVVLAVVLAVPVTGALTSVLAVHSHRLAAQSAAAAAALAVARQGGGQPLAERVVRAHWDGSAAGVITTLDCDPWCARPGARVTVTVTADVDVALWPRPVQVSQQHSQVVDRFVVR